MADKNKLADKNMGLVHACCKRFSGKGIEYEELFASGCLGLAKAINNFDESRNLQFSTYAFPVIMGEIKRLFRDGGAIRVSRTLKELSLAISRLNNESKLKNGRELTVSELAERLDTSEEKIIDAPPHGGMGIGLDRVTMLMCKADSLRDVTAFPKVQNASELMSACPAEVDDESLEVLGIKVVNKED